MDIIPEKIMSMKEGVKKFSIILPIYNQPGQIEAIIKSYDNGLKKISSSYEVLLIINGNDTSSFEIAKKIISRFPHFKIIFIKQSGWGNAIIEGLKRAQGKFICYTNSSRTRTSDLVSILRLAQNNPTVVIKATRILHINLLRKLGSTIYNIECRLLLHTPVWDVNGTPKVIPNQILKRINLSSRNDLIDAELMAKSVKNHIPILEVPILFPPRRDGKSTTNIVSAIKMYLGLIKLKKMLS